MNDKRMVTVAVCIMLAGPVITAALTLFVRLEASVPAPAPVPVPYEQTRQDIQLAPRELLEEWGLSSVSFTSDHITGDLLQVRFVLQGHVYLVHESDNTWPVWSERYREFERYVPPLIPQFHPDLGSPYASRDFLYPQVGS